MSVRTHPLLSVSEQGFRTQNSRLPSDENDRRGATTGRGPGTLWVPGLETLCLGVRKVRLSVQRLWLVEGDRLCV